MTVQVILRYFLCASASIVLVAIGAAFGPLRAEDKPYTNLGVIQGESKLPVPRWVSLKADRVNVRNGPGLDHKVKWVFRRAGLPVEVFEESGNWRRIRDADAAEGWVYHSLLSGRRTALVLPWTKKKDGESGEGQVTVLGSPKKVGNVVVKVEAGVIANISQCDGRWCKISLEGYRGWVEQEKLWGVYPGEKID